MFESFISFRVLHRWISRQLRIIAHHSSDIEPCAPELRIRHDDENAYAFIAGVDAIICAGTRTRDEETVNLSRIMQVIRAP